MVKVLKVDTEVDNGSVRNTNIREEVDNLKERAINFLNFIAGGFITVNVLVEDIVFRIDSILGVNSEQVKTNVLMVLLVDIVKMVI